MDKETIAYNYYTNIVEYGLKKGLDSSLWVQYIILSNDLTQFNIPVRKCYNRALRAHTYLSDYFKQKNK